MNRPKRGGYVVGPDGLTDRQREAWGQICDASAAGDPLTVRQLAARMGYGPNAFSYAHRILCALRRKNLVDWDSDRSGTIRPVIRLRPDGLAALTIGGRTLVGTLRMRSDDVPELTEAPAC